MDKKQQFSLWYFVGTFVFILMLPQLFFAPHAETLAYSDFKKLVAAGKVSEVSIRDRQPENPARRETTLEPALMQNRTQPGMDIPRDEERE